jgi:hypothetical protein
MASVRLGERVNFAAKQLGITAYSNKFTRAIYNVSANAIGVIAKSINRNYVEAGVRREVERAWATINPDPKAPALTSLKRDMAIEYLHQENKPSYKGFIEFLNAQRAVSVEINISVSKQKAPVEIERTSKKGTLIKRDFVGNYKPFGKASDEYSVGAADIAPNRKPLKVKWPK